jgi:LysM repeat protein
MTRFDKVMMTATLKNVPGFRQTQIMTERMTDRLKNWLIIENSAASDSIPLFDEQRHKASIRNKTIGFVSLLLIGYPLLTHANIFQATPVKALFSISKPETVSDIQVREHNSQTAPLLQAATNLDPNPARGGADLNIIENKALVAESGVGGGFVEIINRKNDAISIYEVKEGDTLSQIANMFDVSVNTIKWANNLENGAYPGQSLVILPISGIRHTVKTGGTIADIAAKYKADPKEIALFNGVSIDQQLAVGDIVIVPNVDLAVPEPKKGSSKAIAKSSAAKPASASGSSNWMIKPVSGAYRSQGIHGYNAVDLAAPVGTPIYAAAGGSVIIANSGGGWNGGYGNYVVIKHTNGAQTLYAHMNSVAVSAGTTVGQGEQIGSVGNTGKSTGAHLHFEVRGAKNPF